MLSLVFYVPESHLSSVKNALFAAGAGKIGNYDCCAWQIKGDGQFRALKGSSPYLGKIGEIEHTVEWKVEMVFDNHLREKVLAALIASHPYETPAYFVVKSALD